MTDDKTGVLLSLYDRKIGEPEANYVPGICEECDKEIWIDTSMRLRGMARSCDEHIPLSKFKKK